MFLAVVIGVIAVLLGVLLVMRSLRLRERRATDFDDRGPYLP